MPARGAHQKRESLAKLVFEPPNRLTHRWLRAVQFRGGAGEAALRGHREEHLELGQVHEHPYNEALLKRKNYRLDRW